MSKEITFNSLKPLVRSINKDCKNNPDDKRLQEKRRALLSIRRGIDSPDKDETITEDLLLEIAQVLAKAERLIASNFIDLGLEGRAEQRNALANDIEEVVLEIIDVEDIENIEETEADDEEEPEEVSAESDEVLTENVG